MKISAPRFFIFGFFHFFISQLAAVFEYLRQVADFLHLEENVHIRSINLTISAGKPIHDLKYRPILAW